MPDPLTTATTVAATQIAKKADSYFALLLKPSFELIGKEARALLKEKLDVWKKDRKQKNLDGHVERVAQKRRSAGKKDVAPEPSLSTINVFEEWISGAENVDPDEPVLGAMWQDILDSILDEKKVSVDLIGILKSLSPDEAYWLASLKFGPRPTNSLFFLATVFLPSKNPERALQRAVAFDRLEAKRLVIRDWEKFLGACATITGIASIVVMLFQQHLYSLDYPDTPTGTSQRLSAIIALLFTTAAVSFSLSFIFYRRRIWRPSFMGRLLLEHCSDKAAFIGKSGDRSTW